MTLDHALDPDHLDGQLATGFEMGSGVGSGVRSKTGPGMGFKRHLRLLILEVGMGLGV